MGVKGTIPMKTLFPLCNSTRTRFCGRNLPTSVNLLYFGMNLPCVL